ncbi:MAG: DsbA family protein [Deltaproteobacteria bacterium]|nr:DsbA family protein [Deltaproteobacteria bacterium]MBW2418499.1 DsbA family protein [Deltaproteobacteria bacterium]
MRLRRIEEEFTGQVELSWRSFLLRPEPGRKRDLEKFRAYTKSWRRPAAEADAGEFNEWSTDAGPPSHSVPPHGFAKAAARLGEDAFRRAHEALMRAYFRDNLDISDDATQRALWQELELPAEGLAARDDPAILAEILAEHREALDRGATGVPAIRLEGNDAVIVGAHPMELYRRWVTRTLARSEAGEI